MIKRFTIILCCTAAGSAAASDWGLCNVWPQPDMTFKPAAPNEPIKAGADSVESSEETTTLHGNATVERSDSLVEADKLIYSQSANTVESPGEMRYNAAGFGAVSQWGLIHLDDNSGQFKDTDYFIFTRHARGHSDAVDMVSPDLTLLKGASYTTCDPGHEDWSIRASTVKLDHAEGVGSAYNARLSFKHVPLLYLPYISFPISNERKTGLLPPSYGSAGVGGNEFELPIYVNIHPQLDLTLTPHNYTNRGLQLRQEWRYLTHFGTGIYNNARLDDEVYGHRRSYYDFTHQGPADPHWNWDIYYARVSDKDYFTDFGNALATTSITQIERHAQASYSFAQGSVSTQVEDYLTIDTTVPYSSQPYRRLPQVQFDFHQPLAGALEFNIDGEAVRYHQLDRLSGTRTRLHPKLSLPYQRPAGFIIPTLGTYYTRYILDKNELFPRENYRPQSTVATFTLDSGLFLERDTSLGKTAYLHTLEPRLFYLYAPYQDQTQQPVFDSGVTGFSLPQMFQDNRFTGGDRVGDANQVSATLTTRFLEAESGIERFSTTVGQIIYFDDRRVTLGADSLDTHTNSDTWLEAHAKLGRATTVYSDLLWDTDYDTITRRTTRIQYAPDNRHIINMSYRYQGNRITTPRKDLQREVDFSALWPIDSRWSIIGRRYHSIPNKRTFEKLLGLEYNSCCWTFRAMRRAVYAEYEVTKADGTKETQGDLRYSWYAQLELKGLTSLGRRINNMMQESILGYSAVH